MNEQKNKQQPPQGNKQDKDMNRQGQKPGNHDQEKQQHGEHEKHNVQGEMDESDQPDKKTQIGDNPDETKRKIPNMENDR